MKKMFGVKRERAMSNLFNPNTYTKNTDTVKAVEGAQPYKRHST